MKKIYCNNRDEAIKTREILEDMVTNYETRFEISDLFGLTNDFKSIRAEIFDDYNFKNSENSLVFAKSSEEEYRANYSEIESESRAFEHIKADLTEILVICDCDKVLSGEYQSIDVDYLRGCMVEILWPKCMSETISINLSSEANPQSKVLSYINLLDREDVTENNILISNVEDKKRVNITCYYCKISDIITGIESVAKSVGMSNVERFFADKDHYIAMEYTIEDQFEMPKVTFECQTYMFVNILLAKDTCIAKSDVVKTLQAERKCKGYILNTQYGDFEKDKVQFIYTGICKPTMYRPDSFTHGVVHTNKHLLVVSNYLSDHCLVVKTDDVNGVRNEIFNLVDNDSFKGLFYNELTEKLSKFFNIHADICEKVDNFYDNVYFELKNGQYLRFYSKNSNDNVVFAPNRESFYREYMHVDYVIENDVIELTSVFYDDYGTRISSKVAICELKLVLNAMISETSINKISEYEFCKRLSKLRDEHWVFERFESIKQVQEKLEVYDRMFVHIATDKLDFDVLKEFDDDKILNTSISLNSSKTRFYVLHSNVSHRELKEYAMSY
ncbi:MAG: hypothetical protein R3Y12_05325 [Clostridia bacterium]